MRACVIVVAVAFLLLMSNAFADGTIFAIFGKQRTIVEESEQVAFISWKDGIEQMVIKIGAKTAANEGNTFVWIFPVPADPKDVNVHHIKTLRYDIGGTELYKAVRRDVAEEAGKIFALSQIWPIIPYMIAKQMLEPSDWETSRDGVLASTNYGVTVHKKVDKYGLVSEVITAKDADGLRRYIKGKHGVELPREIEEVFSDYIGKNFTFVVTESNGLPDVYEIVEYWYGSPRAFMDDPAENSGSPKAMAVMVEFPTDRPYFPMKPTSVYGSSTIPITVCIDGFWEPNTWKEIKDKIKVEHRVEGYPPRIKGGGNFRGQFDKFTIVFVKAPSKYLKEDFYFESSSTAEKVNAIREHAAVVGIGIMLIIFGLSGAITWAVLSRRREELRKYITAGMASILTPIASFIVLKRAGITSQISINAPAFKKWWQNVAFYATGAFFAILTILLLSIPAAIMYGLITMLHSIGGAYAVAVGIMLYTAGGALFWAVVGAAILHLMGKKWGQDSATVSVQLPVPQVLAIIILNAVLYAVLKAVLLA